MKTTQRQADSE